MKRTRKSKGIYWRLDVSDPEGKPIPKKIIEVSDIQDFLNWYNKSSKSKFSIRDPRPQNKQESPDTLCVNDSEEWIAIEYTAPPDAPEIVADNIKRASKPNFSHREPGAVLKTDIEGMKSILKDLIWKKDRKSFVNIPHKLDCSKKIVVVNIDDTYDPEGLVRLILQKEAIIPQFENITNVFLIWYKGGTPGQWTCCDIADRILGLGLKG